MGPVEGFQTVALTVSGNCYIPIPEIDQIATTAANWESTHLPRVVKPCACDTASRIDVNAVLRHRSIAVMA